MVEITIFLNQIRNGIQNLGENCREIQFLMILGYKKAQDVRFTCLW